MRSIAYLLAMNAKNALKQLIQKPAKLIMFIGVIALIVFLAIFGQSQQQSATEYADAIYLKGIYFVYLMLFCAIALVKGLSSGDSFFEMSDVNLLFVSPINPKKILLYGLIQMAKTAFWAGFFILFQSSSISGIFGIPFQGLVLLLVGFILVVVVCGILSLLIYSQTNGSAKKQLLVKIGAAAVLAPAVIHFVMAYLATRDPIASLTTLLDSKTLNWIPIAGWTAKGIFEIISGQTMQGLISLGLTVGCGVALVIVMMNTRADYYEDVLCATETSFEKKRAATEGQVNTATSNGRKVRVKGTGLIGRGASVFLGKHLREALRENRLGLMDTASLLITIGAAVMALFLKQAEGSGILTILQTLMWMQIYLIGSGRSLKELYSPYIYMIPESAFRKIVWSNVEGMLRMLLQSVVLFVVCGLIMGESAIGIALSITCYSLFTLLLLGVNYLSMRWTGANLSGGLLIVVYTFAVIVIMLPGLIGAIWAGVVIGGSLGVAIGLLILSAWEFVAALGCFAMSKSVLHRCDIQTMPQR